MKRFWARRWDSVRPPELKDGDKPARSWPRLVVLGLLLLTVLLLGLGSWWSFEPDLADAHSRFDTALEPHQGVAGVPTGLALKVAMQTILEKPGGLLSNDLLPPGRWLDNLPNWEYGVIVQSRDLATALSEDFSRSQAGSSADPALAIAEARFNFDHRSWILPSSEGEFREGIDQLDDYLARLTGNRSGDARFFARADNLARWLQSVENRLGSLSQRLGAAARADTLLVEDLAPAGTGGLQEAGGTPWTEVDDIFFEARGSTWALALFLTAVEQDFGTVLDSRDARLSLQQIILELEAAQEPILGPIVLNGRGFGIFANHSLVMASYVARAHAATIELRSLLAGS